MQAVLLSETFEPSTRDRYARGCEIVLRQVRVEILYVFTVTRRHKL